MNHPQVPGSRPARTHHITQQMQMKGQQTQPQHPPRTQPAQRNPTQDQQCPKQTVQQQVMIPKKPLAPRIPQPVVYYVHHCTQPIQIGSHPRNANRQPRPTILHPQLRHNPAG